jgi:histidine phosphotransfer protein HptB
MMTPSARAIVDWARFTQARSALGENFLRAVGFFREDGAKSIATIEGALRLRNPIAIIGPADLLKADALQIGALSVAELAEDVEFGARDCVEWHQASDLLLEPVLALRAAFDDTLLQLERETNPLVMRRAG